VERDVFSPEVVEPLNCFNYTHHPVSELSGEKKENQQDLFYQSKYQGVKSKYTTEII